MNFLIPNKRFGNEMGGPSASLGGKGVWGGYAPAKPAAPTQITPKPLPLPNGGGWGDMFKDVQLGAGDRRGNAPIKQKMPIKAQIPTRRPGSQPSTRRAPNSPAPTPQPAPPLQATPPMPAGAAAPSPEGIDWAAIQALLQGMG